jgi:hypothetical protein
MFTRDTVRSQSPKAVLLSSLHFTTTTGEVQVLPLQEELLTFLANDLLENLNAIEDGDIPEEHYDIIKM